MGVHVIQFIPELCAPCAEKALDPPAVPAPGSLRARLCDTCRKKISAAAEAFADAVAKENESESEQTSLRTPSRRAILRERKRRRKAWP